MLKKRTTIDNYKDQRTAVYNLLCSVVEQAAIDYLNAKLYLYRLDRNDPKILKTIELNNKTVDEFRTEVEGVINDCKDLFMREDYKKLYGNKNGNEVITVLDHKFINEVIPTYEETGRWYYETQFTIHKK